MVYRPAVRGFRKTGKYLEIRMEAVKRILAKVVGEEVSVEELEMVTGAGRDKVSDHYCGGGGTVTGFGEGNEPICDA